GAGPLACQAALELVDQPALAEASLAHHGDGLPLALLDEGPAGKELLELRVAPDEAGETPLRLDVESAPDGAVSNQLVGRRGGVAAFEQDRADRAPLEGRWRCGRRIPQPRSPRAGPSAGAAPRDSWCRPGQCSPCEGCRRSGPRRPSPC